MRVTNILATAILGFSQIVAAQDVADDADVGAVKAETCTTCHNAMVSLKGRGEAVIAKQIKNLRAGESEHPPGLAALKEEDIADISIYLDTAD